MSPYRNIVRWEVLGKESNGGFGITEKSGLVYQDDKLVRYGHEGHYGYPNFPDKRQVGGPWYLEGVTTERQTIDVGEIWRGGENQSHYTGKLMVGSIHTGGWNGTFLPDAWGASAYSKMKPAQPSFQALNAIYELKDLPGMLHQRFLNNNLKSIGNYWLALQFGWKPLLNDVRNYVIAQMGGQKRLKQLLRDNGKPVRRRIILLDTDDMLEDVTIGYYGSFEPILVTQYYRKEPHFRRVTTNRERVWASARFRYWLPDGPMDVGWKTMMLARIFGFNPTPSAVYNAIPWSWLIDWHGNVGDLLENLDTGVADRLAADYFYIMRHKEWKIASTAFGYFKRRDGSNVDIVGQSSSTAFTKVRSEGDPFGFATAQNSLSGMQLSILGALGLSRLR